MLKYLKAENLKSNRTFVKKLIFLAPMVTLMLAFLAGPWFQINGFNWWYIMIAPGYVSLMAALTNQREEKKLHYQAVFALPISLQKVWISKNLVMGIYLFLSCIVLLFGILLGGFQFSKTVSTLGAVIATFIIAVTFLWQIPFCLFLAKKLGLIATILINTGIGLILNLATVTTSIWWICPYSWVTRIVCPIIGILPNGTLAEPGNKLLNASVIPIGISLSIVLFFILLIATANWFKKQEVI